LNYDLSYWDHKVIRDPLYGFIHLTERETLLINTPFMHRLTRIKQLAHTYLVYPSAVHTRFEHSLGILYIADRMCSCFKIKDEKREIARIAALLHDVGHGPFSHLFEDILIRINGPKFSHEKITKEIITYDKNISSILKGKINSTTELSNIHSDIISVFDKEKEYDTIIRAIISSQLDADKLDYLRRDSYHTGSTYGIFDLERILFTLTVAEDEGIQYPVIKEKGIPSVESFRLARYSLYSQVVQHHTRVIADQMFLRSLELAIFSEKIISEKLFKFEGRQNDFINNYFTYDDYSIYELILNAGKPNDYSFKIMNDLKNRHLFKRAYEIYIEEIQIGKRLELTKKREILEKYEGEIAETTQIPRELIIMYLETNESGMKSYQSSSESYASDEMPFLYIDNNGKIKPMDDKFSLIPKGNLQPKLYVFTNQDNISKANHVCKEIFEK
jgi:uncharacterized protein